jgi:hypothetical protein
VERSRLPYYTKALTGLRYVEKVLPLLTYREQPQRKVLYRIADPLLRFWFTFVYPNSSSLNRVEPERFFTSAVLPRLDAFWGTSFESVAAGLFAERIVASHATEAWKTGTYWDKEIQVDFTVAMKSGFSYLGEAEWGRVDRRAAEGFRDKLAVFKDRLSYRPVVVSMEPLPAGAGGWKGVDAYSVSDLTGGRPR